MRSKSKFEIVAPFKSEKELRRYMRLWFRDDIYFIEPGRGGTVGFQDTLLARDGELIPIELKKAVRKIGGGLVSKARTGQKRILQRMGKQGVSCFILACVVGEKRMAIVRGDEYLVNGWFTDDARFANDDEGILAYIDEWRG